MSNLSLERLQTALEPMVSSLVLLDQVDSTHEMARRLIDQVDEEGAQLNSTLILARTQSSGRGRDGRSWMSPADGLYFNWLKGDLDPALVSALPLIAASAAHRAISALGIVHLAIKWPNDLLVESSKIAGLLVHARHGESVMATIGLGVNLQATPTLEPDDPTRPTAVGTLLGAGDLTQRATTVVSVFLENLEHALLEPGDAVEHWRENLLHRRGDPMNIRLTSGETLRGAFVDVNPEGHIRLSTDDGVKTFTGGDILE